jgi:hypothetical protein
MANSDREPVTGVTLENCYRQMDLYAHVCVLWTSSFSKFIPCLSTNSFLHEVGRRALKFHDKQNNMITVIK